MHELHEWLTRDHLPVIGALTQNGQWFKQVQHGAFDGGGVVRFLRYLLRCVAGKLLVLWDGAPIQRSQAVKEFLRRGAAKRLQLEVLPGYAPELNPVESVWKHLASQAGGTQELVLPERGASANRVEPCRDAAAAQKARVARLS